MGFHKKNINEISNCDLKVTSTFLGDVLLIEPKIHCDTRGTFYESYVKGKYEAIGIWSEFVQDNHSISQKNTLRGLHYQLGIGQEKLVRVTHGEIFDVAVDIRKNSSTYGKWIGFYLSEKNHKQLYIPVGFAHGFCVLSDVAEVLYKCSSLYSPEDERGVMWNDPDIAIEWPIKKPILSERDCRNPYFREISN